MGNYQYEAHLYSFTIYCAQISLTEETKVNICCPFKKESKVSLLTGGKRRVNMQIVEQGV